MLITYLIFMPVFSCFLEKRESLTLMISMGNILLRHHYLENLYKPEYKRTAVDIILLSFRFLWS